MDLSAAEGRDFMGFSGRVSDAWSVESVVFERQNVAAEAVN